MWASFQDLQKAENYQHTTLGDAMKPLAINGVSVEAFKSVSYFMMRIRKGDACHYRVDEVRHIALVDPPEACEISGKIVSECAVHLLL